MTEPVAPPKKPDSDDDDDWHTPFVAQISVTMPNGGTVTMQAPSASSFAEGLEKLEVTHAQYLAFGGWGGGRAIALFLMATNLLC